MPQDLNEIYQRIFSKADDIDLDSDTRLQDLEHIVTLGQGLLDYNRETGLITLGHSSVKTFLTSSYIEQSDVPQFMISESEAHNTIMCTFARIHALLEYPLLEYETHNWPLHIRNENALEWDHINGFLSTQYHNCCGSYGFWISFLAPGLEPEVIFRSAPLYYAASFGFAPLVKALILQNQNINFEKPRGRCGSTALEVACFRRQKETSRLLAEACANAFAIGLGDGFDAIWWASKNGWDGVVRIMVQVEIEKGFSLEFSKNHIEPLMEPAAKGVQAVALNQMQIWAMARWLSQ
ncbi:hypothetical protein DM02DRAFT_680822 [Periconia macrospinosa]|uniref:Uncharacterized protein n=1 Tax=Periconia macrospinosa TaxID=97972 RepID=A0A2V1DML3_9PLEO|nr:hypothetical protein DM02DRAFT_680822 [Periconia macrospinosa]